MSALVIRLVKRSVCMQVHKGKSHKERVIDLAGECAKYVPCDYKWQQTDRRTAIHQLPSPSAWSHFS